MWRLASLGIFLIGVVFLGVQLWAEARKPGRFPLREVRMVGVVHTSMDQVWKLIGVGKGINLLRIDPREIKKQLSTLPWVRSVRVKRLLPATLVIQLVEKVAVCLGREGDRLIILDEYGTVIKPLAQGDPLVLPVVTVLNGKEKSTRVVRILNLLGRHPWLRQRVSEAVEFVDNQLTLFTRRGVRILLSERADNELQLLKRLQEQFKILDRRIRQVELRIAGRAAVRPVPSQ